MRFRSSGVKLKSSKRLLFRKVVTYLGHIVSESGIKTYPVKVERVCEWPHDRTEKSCTASTSRSFIQSLRKVF